ncbi:MAG: B12-binding domain-containing radical SAM protein [bacterium]
MRTLLLSPPQENVYGRLTPPYPPLGLLQIGACLRAAGNDVVFLDAALYPARVATVAKYFRPEMVCITSVTPTFPKALELARFVKGELDVPVVFGGPHVSMIPEESLGSGDVDFAVVGEGEQTVVELARAIEGGNPLRVTGVWTRCGGEAIFTGRRAPVEQLDTLPFPDWSLVEHVSAYAPPDALNRRVLTIITSRGCPFDCSFCMSSKLFDRRIRRRSVENVLAEIEHLLRRERAREIHFADDCFTSDRQWVLDFCRALRSEKLRLNLSFMNGVRADEVDEEILAALRGAGVRTVGFGVESFDEKLMRESGKRLTLDSVEHAFRVSKSLGLRTWGFFIIGFPEETREQALSTLAFAKKLAPDFAKFFPLVPYPGSEIFKKMEASRLPGHRDWNSFGLYSGRVPTLSRMDSCEIAALIAAFYRKFYLRPGRLLAMLSKMRTASQLFLSLRMMAFLIDRFVGRDVSERA